MKNLTLFLIILAVSLSVLSGSYSAAVDTTWIRAYGYKGYGHNAYPTCDGGYMIAATLGSDTFDGPWLIKTNSIGNVL